MSREKDWYKIFARAYARRQCRCKDCARFKERELQMGHSQGAIGCNGLDHILLQEADLFFASLKPRSDRVETEGV